MSKFCFYWDSGVFCSFFSDEPGRADLVEELLEDAHQGAITIVTSTFALTEVIKVKGHRQISEEDEQRVIDFV